ncbi:hypothetical protein DYQ86_17280 [Acidobacteria bacterium AB60]|nr:hypothetical protein DYQ86_17280 [Acidobacteria bacterium AB60]
MKILKVSALAAFLLFGALVPAIAQVTVYSPANGASVGSPFTLYAVSPYCSNQPVTAMGFSFDNGATQIYSGTQMDGPVTEAAGGHVLHVKSWGNQGSACMTDVAITVGATSAAVPSNALSNGNLQAASNWTAVHDAGTPGSSYGGTSLTGSPSRSGTARGFLTDYSYYGGERFALHFGSDTAAQNFLYDGWLYISGSSAGIASIEMDMNQTMPNGQTVIYGFQCDGWSGTWDYTANTGSIAAPKDQWIHSSQPCNVKNWSVNQWHHVQIQYSRDTWGNVLYNYVILDGKQQYIGAKVFSAFALGWGPTLITNLQIDGATSGSGSSNIYLDNLIVYRW